ncbi:hypothetical protein G3N95_10020 [Paraburkholderia sp. Tr-20389]|uniref:hypothetical protein n=1 Tax=Paraburkholderia sp. Tr-20389 TaxID=2703903 RepID=UPI001982312C|nr:hypothetical protein [Paraburkholderia sp. Tr-20389]MBN3753281.1 hypothetical protein [Paraburkholderia sp. Tr-20389]
MYHRRERVRPVALALRISVPPERMYSYLRGIVKSEDVMNRILQLACELLPPGGRKAP